MAIKKRCIRCNKHLRADGTCQNPNCVRYVPDKEPIPVEPVPPTTSVDSAE